MSELKSKCDSLLEHLAHAWEAGGFGEFAQDEDFWPPEVTFSALKAGGRARCAYHLAAVIEGLKIMHDQEKE